MGGTVKLDGIGAELRSVARAAADVGATRAGYVRPVCGDGEPIG